MGEQRALRPGRLRVLQQGQQAAPLRLGFGGRRQRGAGQRGPGAEDVDMRRQRRAVGRRHPPRPAPERHGARAAQPGRALGAAHAGVEHLHPRRAAIVIHEHHQGVLGDAPCIEFGEQTADVLVDVVDHAKEVGRVFIRHLVRIERLVFRTGEVGAVRGVGGDVAVKRRPALLRLDPAFGLAEKDVGAVAGGLDEPVVVQDDRVEVVVARSVAAAARIALADAAAAVDELLVEAATDRLEGRLVAQVPLAEDAGAVAGGLQDARDGHGLRIEALALEDGVGDAVAEFVTAG